MNCSRAFWGLSVLPLLVAFRVDAQWPRFRGPNGSGVDSTAGYPVDFSPTKNVVWKRSVPYGQSSPVVAGGRVFLTASEGDRLLTICLDARSGRELWRREIRREHANKIFRANDPASPTPAADANGVVVFFPDLGLIAYTNEGKERWTLRLGPFQNFYGMAASPVIAGEMVVLVCDQQSGSYLIALDRNTGRQVWKTERAGTTVGWATPMVFRPSKGPAELTVLGSTRLDSYYLATGERRWWRPLASTGGVGTAVAEGDTVFSATLAANEPWMPTFESMLEKYDKDKDHRLSEEEFRADAEMGEYFGWLDANNDHFIDAQEWNEARKMGIGEYGAIALHTENAKGQLGADAVRWQFKKNLPFLPAPLVYQGVFYMVRDGGIITSLDSSTGKLLKEGRTREALGEYYASPIAADGKLFLASVEGKITVLKASGEWEVLRMNDLAEEIHATPALSEGRIYVRTHGALYCFADAAH